MIKRPTPNGLMTAPEVAAHFGCNVSSVWRWAKTGAIPKPIKIAGLTRWRRADIEALTASEAA